MLEVLCDTDLPVSRRVSYLIVWTQVPETGCGGTQGGNDAWPQVFYL